MKIIENYIFKLIPREEATEHIQAFKTLALKTYSQYFDRITPENVLLYKKTLDDVNLWTWLTNTAQAFVCMDAGELAGMAFMVPGGNPTDIFRKEWAYLRLVGVEPGHQGKGIAKTLTRMCVEQARATGEKNLALHTAEIQYSARHVYESLGFKKVMEIEPVYGLQYWLYLMELQAWR